MNFFKNILKKKDTFTIKVMMEDDMFKSLKKWGYMGALKDGYITCPCGETVTEENLTAIKPKNGRVLFYHSIICVND